MFTETSIEPQIEHQTEEEFRVGLADRNKMQREVMAQWMSDNGAIISDVMDKDLVFREAYQQGRWEEAKNIIIEKIKENYIH